MKAHIKTKKIVMWYKVKNLKESEGLNKSQIAKELGIDRSTVRRYLSMDEERINSDNFLRAHRSYLVNLHHIEKIQGCCEQLEMIEGHSVPVSRRRKKELKQTLRNVMKLV